MGQGLSAPVLSKMPLPDNYKQTIPERCDVCQNPKIYYGNNSVIYGINRGKWPKCYFCPQCKAVVSCHPGTNIPKGRMATASLRRYRQKAHKVFDLLWHENLCSRDEAYSWMADLLQLDSEHAHIGLLSREQLETLIAACPARFKALERRKAKQYAKIFERNNREQQAANRGRR